MSLEIELTNDNLANFARSRDALEAFYNSVNNGQMRLALEVFAEILPVLTQKIADLEKLASSEAVEKKLTEKETTLPEDKPKTKANKSLDSDSKDQTLEA